MKPKAEQLSTVSQDVSLKLIEAEWNLSLKLLEAKWNYTTLYYITPLVINLTGPSVWLHSHVIHSLYLLCA